ncbi:hypothetical protein EYF80_047456 [Liparis tanakae]|uniref:Uncharacterized protein n=1 Tax=Liparis tanakae TaxID=230148 RepID=A0A4Z2FMW3_9TELE|nr:hypothetical protein EYF80_047456 [Liparis tanakae]
MFPATAELRIELAEARWVSELSERHNGGSGASGPGGGALCGGIVKHKRKLVSIPPALRLEEQWDAASHCSSSRSAERFRGDDEGHVEAELRHPHSSTGFLHHVSMTTQIEGLMGNVRRTMMTVRHVRIELKTYE